MNTDKLLPAIEILQELNFDELTMYSIVVKCELDRRTREARESTPPAPPPPVAIVNDPTNTDRPPPMLAPRKKVPHTAALGVWEVEGFKIVCDGDLGPFTFDRAAKGVMTVQTWKDLRFNRLYPHRQCKVLLVDGTEARSNSRLASVRAGYQMASHTLS